MFDGPSFCDAEGKKVVFFFFYLGVVGVVVSRFKEGFLIGIEFEGDLICYKRNPKREIFFLEGSGFWASAVGGNS